METLRGVVNKQNYWLCNKKHQNQLAVKTALHWWARTSIFAPCRFGGYLPRNHYSSVQTRALHIWISDLQHNTSLSHEGTQSCKKSQELLQIQPDKSTVSCLCIPGIQVSMQIKENLAFSACVSKLRVCVHCTQWCSNAHTNTAAEVIKPPQHRAYNNIPPLTLVKLLC